jgi:hypothetical protein
MMNTNKNNSANDPCLSSAKSSNDLSYRNIAELELITNLDRDTKIAGIEQFLIPIFDHKTHLLIEEAIGFFLQKIDGSTTCLVVSDYLCVNPHFANQMKGMLARGKKCSFLFAKTSNLNGLRY